MVLLILIWKKKCMSHGGGGILMRELASPNAYLLSLGQCDTVNLEPYYLSIGEGEDMDSCLGEMQTALSRI